MSDATPPTTLPALAPVPRKRMRHKGWSADRQREFIERLAETGSVRAACRMMGVGEHHIYKLRRHPEAESFRQAWEAALDMGIRRIEDVAMDRALNGVEEPVYHRGEIVGTRRVYNDRLLMFLLRNRASERFAADGAKGLSGLGAHRLAQMKKEWRAEWDREQIAASRKSQCETLDRLNTKLDRMRERKEAMMSPKTRRMKKAYEQSLERDKADPYTWMDEAEASGGVEAEAEGADDMDVIGPDEEMRKLLSNPHKARLKADDGWEVFAAAEREAEKEAENGGED